MSSTLCPATAGGDAQRKRKPCRCERPEHPDGERHHCACGGEWFLRDGVVIPIAPPAYPSIVGWGA